MVGEERVERRRVHLASGCRLLGQVDEGALVPPGIHEQREGGDGRGFGSSCLCELRKRPRERSVGFSCFFRTEGETGAGGKAGDDRVLGEMRMGRPFSWEPSYGVDTRRCRKRKPALSCHLVF
ncbi:hypothetical protein KFK09_009217 [Dendrobium nobile]|uniref:Uncharacterized protein n=1 Tax=Dendrobium nobile TaxID=94219 RepID=A0A8T3BS17_DENNO|nr:hypothetical protein KFK09_009217 [Dendrobium nobile]